MSHQFDELAKALAQGVPRREALRRIGTGLVGALLASVGLGEAWGQSGNNCTNLCRQIPPGPNRGRCLRNCQECGGDVTRVCRTAFGNTICCPPHYICCDGVCVDKTAPENCGGCGNRCAADEVCRAAPTGGQPYNDYFCCRFPCTNNVETVEFCCHEGCIQGFGCV
jgi:hypothetical protein